MQSVLFCRFQGVMSDAIDWDLLQQQYMEDPLFYNDISNSCRILDNPLHSNLGLHIMGSEYYRHAWKNLSFQSVTPNFLVRCAKKCSAYTNFESSQLPTLFEKQRDSEAVCLMRGLMDECTHLKNFQVPYDPTLAITVAAKCDGYVPRDGCSNLEDLWPGATVRYIDGGHVGAYLWHMKTFQ